MSIQSARFNLKADAMVVTNPMSIGNMDLTPGDFLVSDGKKTWGVRFEEFGEKGPYRPTGERAKALLLQAAELRTPVTQTELEGD